MKLLIVEDNADMRRLLRSLVADLAEEITECSDGDEVVTAYEAAHLGAADRVLMDLHMPRVNGLDATRQLRAVFPEAHVIIVTQDDNAHARNAVLAAGASAYVLKDNLLAGGGFRHGQHIAFKRNNNTPLSNLFVTMLQRLGIEANAFGSSMGTLTGLDMA